MTPNDMIDFDNLSTNQQHQAIAQATKNKNISWKVALAVLYPKFKDRAFVSNLIQQYIHDLCKQTAANNKRPIAHLSPTNKNKVTAAMYKKINNSYIRCRIPFDASTVDLEIRNHFETYQETNNKHTEQATTVVEHHNLNINNILGNSKRYTEETHMLALQTN